MPRQQQTDSRVWIDAEQKAALVDLTARITGDLKALPKLGDVVGAAVRVGLRHFDETVAELRGWVER